MAKFTEIEEENQAIFTEIINATDLRNIAIKILANNALKEVGKTVKANDMVKYLAEEDIVIVINEVIFDLLEPLQKRIVADELVAGISLDLEKDKITLSKPDFTIHTGVLSKYGSDVCIRLNEQIKLMFTQEADKENDEEGANF